jgi:hypothetical protein
MPSNRFVNAWPVSYFSTRNKVRVTTLLHVWACLAETGFDWRLSLSLSLSSLSITTVLITPKVTTNYNIQLLHHRSARQVNPSHWIIPHVKKIADPADKANGSSCRKVVTYLYNTGRWTKFNKLSILTVIYHHQYPLISFNDCNVSFQNGISDTVDHRLQVCAKQKDNNIR